MNNLTTTKAAHLPALISARVSDYAAALIRRGVASWSISDRRAPVGADLIALRPYQRESVDAVLDYWREGGGDPLVEMATGTGNSVVIATLLRELIAAYPTLRVEYQCGLTTYREWIALEHAGFAQARAHAWWRTIIGEPIPATVDAALTALRSPPQVQAVTVKRDGKFWTVTGRRVARPGFGVVEVDDRLRARPVEMEAA